MSSNANIFSSNPLKPPYPPHLQSPESATPWRASQAVFKRFQQGSSSDIPYKKIPLHSSDPDAIFVQTYFDHDKPINRSIKEIYCIHQPALTAIFENALLAMELEAQNPKFKPGWRNSYHASQRQKVYERWKNSTALFNKQLSRADTQKPLSDGIKVLPLWHGSSEDKCDSIARSGFTYFGKHDEGKNMSTDSGYFGSGVYFTNSARYAAGIYSDGQNLLFAWVSMREPYPVINDKPHPEKGSDMKMLQGKGAFENYNAHYIPVASLNPTDPKCRLTILGRLASRFDKASLWIYSHGRGFT
jgi:hypothetical protein